MKKYMWVLPFVVFANVAQAHVGHGAHLSLMDGLLHPFGLDHVLAMLAVGLWAARHEYAQSAWYAPLAFVLSLLVGAVVAHLTQWNFAWAESLIALSVILFAVLLLMPRLSLWFGFALIVPAGLTHGWAHGAEATQGGVFVLYVTGFVVSTMLLHVLGVLLGRRLLALRHATWGWHGVSAFMGGYGLYALMALL